MSEVSDLEAIEATRIKIIGLISRELARLNTSMSDWQKIQFSNAIGALLMNVMSFEQPTVAWLRLCLVDVEKALFVVDGIEVKKIEYAQAPDYDELVLALQSVVEHLNLLRTTGKPIEIMAEVVNLKSRRVK